MLSHDSRGVKAHQSSPAIIVVRGCARTVRLGADRLPTRRELKRLVTQSQGSGARLKQHAAVPTSVGRVIALLGEY
jgi:hypothetical protein